MTHYQICVWPDEENKWHWHILLMPEGSIIARQKYGDCKMTALEAFLAADIYMRSYLPTSGQVDARRALGFAQRRVASRQPDGLSLGQMVQEIRQAGDTVPAATGLYSRYDAAK